ncbi:MAG TPA: GNAT family N-acetyltransferase [Bryobacteraceae bacterium]|nr:GNAT family N-acetyltransferase [Bryobacteraceae bacterium]
MREYGIIDENLRAAMRFFGEASGSGEVRPLHGSIAMFSGLDYGVFNIALLTSRAIDGDLEARLRDVARYFRERTMRWSFWLCEDMLDSEARRHAHQTFGAFGMRAISNPPGMLAPTLIDPVRALPAIECRPVADKTTRAAFAEITSVCFDIPYVVAHAVYSREQAWKCGYEGFIGLVEGKPVAIIAIVNAAGAIGIYSLATLPGFRRHGYGEALLRAAASDAHNRTGLSKLVLQSTEAGYELYKRMGFRDVTKFAVYLTK